MKEPIAVLFGGSSAEHEISIITALQALAAFDPEKYEAFPLYIAPQGKWYTGSALLDKGFYSRLSSRLAEVTEVALLPDPSIQGVVRVKQGKIDLSDRIPIDVCFLAFHGQQGEDGCIQGLLELAGLPYTGGGVLNSALSMNKYACKMFLAHHGIPVLPAALVRREETQKALHQARRRITEAAGLEKYPLFVKPNNLGSSIGISSASSEGELAASLAKVFQFDSEAIVEPCVTDPLEINVAVKGGAVPHASVVEIPIATGKILSFEDKYLRGGEQG